MIPKQTNITSKHIRDSAQGEICTLQIAGVCNGNPKTTVLAHLPHNTHGWGIKATDLCAVYACSSCHDVLDRRVKHARFELDRDFYCLRAWVNTLSKLYEKGIITIKGA